jgi:2-hydroxychromene-2-carboxylate isomerase
MSSALLVDYLRAEPAFCALGSGCDVVRRTAGYVFDFVPIPVLGVVAFAGLLGLSLVGRARVVTAWAGLFGSVVAVALIGWQVGQIGALCWMCTVVDVAAIAAGGFGFMAQRAKDEDDAGRVGPVAWMALALLALLVPVGLGRARPSAPVPPGVAALWKPGMINIVEFSDFECPFCRLAHPGIEAARKAAAPGQVNFVRKTMPLPRHPHARDASRAWMCATMQGRGDEMADQLFTTVTDEMTPEGCEAAAKAAGCDVAKYRACMADPASDAAVSRDVALVTAADFQGLPTVWIGDNRLLGAHDAADYANAVASVAAGHRKGDPQYWPLGLVVVMGVGLFGLGIRREA